MSTKNIKILGIISALLANADAQADTMYTYSYAFSSGDIVSGSFSGIASGNLITNLSNITASLDGIAFNVAGNGSLYDFSFTSDIAGSLAGGFSFTTNNSGTLDPKTTWITGGAIASFDGTQNNFLFIDSDQPDNKPFTNYFAIGNAFGDYRSVAAAGITVNEAFSTDNWTVTEVTPAVPIPAAVWLFGSVLMGWLGANSRRSLPTSLS